MSSAAKTTEARDAIELAAANDAAALAAVAARDTDPTSARDAAALDEAHAPTRPAMRVIAISDADLARWDAFVDATPDATFFHRAGWKTVIERAFGHRTHYLAVEHDGEIEGILPLAEVKSALFGHTLVSLPFCVTAGIVARSGSAARALDAAAVELAERLGVDHLEYRALDVRHPDWVHGDTYCNFSREIDADPDVNLAAIPRKQRAEVRKGIKAGLTSRVHVSALSVDSVTAAGEDDDGIDAFFAAYSESVHRLGTPVFAKRYFRVLREVFGDACDVMTIHGPADGDRQGSVVAAVLSFRFRDRILPYYGGGTAAARALSANDFMYWELMRRAALSGIRVFDFGRSKIGTGAWQFKKNWGFEPLALAYEYKPVRAKSISMRNPLNPKYAMAIKAWQRLPLPVANALGPHLVKYLG